MNIGFNIIEAMIPVASVPALTKNPDIANQYSDLDLPFFINIEYNTST
jgi:hypothetical protein